MSSVLSLAFILLVQKTSINRISRPKQPQPGDVSQRSYQVSQEDCLGHSTSLTRALERTNRRR